MKSRLLIQIAAFIAAAQTASADNFFPIVSVTSATSAQDLFPAARLIEGPGVGFTAAEPHTRLGGNTWVTNDPNGGAGDYFDPLPTPSPVLVFDLGQNRKLSEISVWGYSDGNANGVKDFTLRFATAADGTGAFGSSITYSPSFTITRPVSPRQSLSFTEVVEARYVELTPTDNFYGVAGGGPGGDRAGLGEVAFEDRTVASTPTLDVAATSRFYVNNGVAENFSLPVGNLGLNFLSITGGTFSGPNASAFSIQSFPGAIGALQTGNIIITVNPVGQPASMEATLQIVSNDPASPKLVTVRADKPVEFYPVASVSSTTAGTDFYAAGNLIQGIGIGFEAGAPHNQLAGDGATMLWVTNAPNGGTGDYFSPVPDPAPVMVFDFGENRLLSEVSVWGYSSGNANGMSNFRLRFATDADGPAGFSTSITYEPEFSVPFGALSRNSFDFSRLVNVRYVELTPLDNYYGIGTVAGGDRVGIGEVAFEVTTEADPRAIVASAEIPITTKGAPVSGTLQVSNAGATQNLTFTSVTPAGTNAGLLQITAIPSPVSPGGNGLIGYTFTPGTHTGSFSTSMVITTNDPLRPQIVVPFTGVVQNPAYNGPATFTSGPFPAGSGVQTITIPVTNDGAGNALTLTNPLLTGAQAANFSLTTLPASIPGGGTASIVLSFDPQGADGVFRAVLRGSTNDPLQPVFSISLLVTVDVGNPLVAWWPLDTDGTDASGNGHDGVAVGSPVADAGANTATAGGMRFDGASRFDVPFATGLNPQSFTITLWANPDSAGGGAYRSPITSRDDFAGGASTFGFILYNDAAGLWSFWSGDGDAGWNTLNGPGVTTGAWTHLAIVYDALTNTKTLYVDGAAAGTTTGANPVYVPNGTQEQEALHIGAGQDDGNNFWFTGVIDDVGLFRSALPEADIQAIMTGGLRSFLFPEPDFKILSITAPAAGSLSLTFESNAGDTYRIQRSTALSGWTTLPGSITGLAGSTTATDSTVPTAEKRVFYRILRE